MSCYLWSLKCVHIILPLWFLQCVVGILSIWLVKRCILPLKLLFYASIENLWYWLYQLTCANTKHLTYFHLMTVPLIIIIKLWFWEMSFPIIFFFMVIITLNVIFLFYRIYLFLFYLMKFFLYIYLTSAFFKYLFSVHKVIIYVWLL